MNNYELFNKLLNNKIGKSNFRYKDYIAETTIEAVEYNIDFFKNVPQEDIELVFIKLIEILYNYDYNEKNLLNYINNEPTIKEESKKASEILTQDINTIKKYQKMIERMYASDITPNKHGFCTLINAPDIVKINYRNNIKILKDLEEKKFEIISKYKFHNLETNNKSTLRKYLKELREKYKLKNVSLCQKHLIDSIDTYTKERFN